MKLVIGLVIGAVVGALIGYLVWGRQVADLQARVAQLEAKLASAPAPTPTPTLTSACSNGGNPHVAVIEVLDDTGGKCKAKVSPACIGNKRNMNVFWAVDYDSTTQTCAGTGQWKAELRFANDPNGPVYNGTNNIGVDPNARPTKYKIKNTDNFGNFPYVVWFVPNGGTAYAMADPELQIEQ